MIKIEHVITPSPEQWEAVILGCRNPMNSWNKSDSTGVRYTCELTDSGKCVGGMRFDIGPNDQKLMSNLAKAGPDHRKFMRMLPVYMDITAPLYWWKEFDTYKVGTVANSCSTMHKIHEKEFSIDDFSCEHLTVLSKHVLSRLIDDLNIYRNLFVEGGEADDTFNGIETEYEKGDKKTWWQMIQLLPSSYNQKRTVMLNYEVLHNIYHARKNHKLDEWVNFCKEIEKLPYSELIIGD